MSRRTVRQMGQMLKTSAALVLALLAYSAITALASDQPPKIPSHRAYKATIDDGALHVIVGQTRTVSDNPAWDDTSDADAVTLTCPAGMRAVTGGFEAPDSAAVLLSGSHPGDTPQQWTIEVLYLGDGSPTTWVPNVTCA